LTLLSVDEKARLRVGAQRAKSNLQMWVPDSTFRPSKSIHYSEHNRPP
jgi:hypothetical protein